MSETAGRNLLVALATLLSACATSQISPHEIAKSDPGALALVKESQRAHGAEAFAKVRDVSVSYEGRWAAVGPRFQPVLADTAFRRRSEERLLVRERVIAQEHTGPAGTKVVVRSPKTVTVVRNGTPSADSETDHAAALVADAYVLFLLGPLAFDRPGVVLIRAGEATVDQANCDRVLAVLRPGFGSAEEDRIFLFIDQTTKQLRRVRLTLNGLESTQGAEIDVTFRDFRRIGGVLWPTEFDERIRVPFDLPAHRWRLVGLEINRGFRARDLTAAGFAGRAAGPATALAASPE